MVLFGVLAYIFLNSGFNTKTRIKVDYENNSEVFYKVNYVDSQYNIIDNDLEEACNKLVEKANALGGYDNISIIIVKRDEE